MSTAIRGTTRLSSRPVDIEVERANGVLRILWADGHTSVYAQTWLRANCPCASCREDRRETRESDGLRLFGGQAPSAQAVGADLVGNYALRLDWADGHNSGFYAFSALRAACPCDECNPDGPPPLLPDDDVAPAQRKGDAAQ